VKYRNPHTFDVNLTRLVPRQGNISMIFDAVKIELTGAALSDINDRYVDGLIQFGGPTGQIRGIMAWDVSMHLFTSPVIVRYCAHVCAIKLPTPSVLTSYINTMQY